MLSHDFLLFFCKKGKKGKLDKKNINLIIIYIFGDFNDFSLKAGRNRLKFSLRIFQSILEKKYVYLHFENKKLKAFLVPKIEFLVY